MVPLTKKGTAVAALWLIAVWKNIFQIQNGCCRFTPTCSEYAREALKKKPLVTALFLIGRRLLSCHPLHKGGYDPVPEKTITPERVVL
jgi:putative membrane protein insertion efficiency factor